MNTNQSRLIYLVAGEASGDVIGGHLISALRRLSPLPLKFVGVGGERMLASGLQSSLFPMSDLSVMGISEVVTSMPRLALRLHATVQHAASLKPDCLVCIDSKGFNRRLIRKLRGWNIPLLQYVAPSVWAYKNGHAQAHSYMATTAADHLLLLFPFERSVWNAIKAPVTVVGPPVFDSLPASPLSQTSARQRLGIQRSTTVLCVMPGSRPNEIDHSLRFLPLTLTMIRKQHPDLLNIILCAPSMTAKAKARLSQQPNSLLVCNDNNNNARLAWAASDVGLALSGSVVLESLMHNLPLVVYYKSSCLTAIMARKLAAISHVSIPNIISGSSIVPELIFDNCTHQGVSAAVSELLNSKSAQLLQLQEVQSAMEGVRALAHDKLPSERAAEVVLKMCGLV